MNDETMWTALTARDAQADGRFWYGVLTTGVYCRPSCAARPLRQNVRFFASPEAARATGLRPCKRCKPDALSPPADVREQALRYAFVSTSLGLAIIAASARGICELAFGDDESTLREALSQRYDGAIEPAALDDARFEAWSAVLDRRLAGDGSDAPLPLDVQGTAFQRSVWQQLQHIPSGRVASYREVADALAQPRAVRAVAQACAANRIGVLIPCHRVVRSDGAVGGYRWGIPRKRALLDAERTNAARQP